VNLVLYLEVFTRRLKIHSHVELTIHVASNDGSTVL